MLFFSFLTKTCYKSEDVVGSLPFVNCVVPRQGPNYVLAKRMQTWRALMNRASGLPVSLNVAPTTKTVSVMKNKVFAFTMAGMPSFEPMEPFETETTKSVMTALLVRDFFDPKSCSNPETQLSHPLQLLEKTQVHGGMYRTGLSFDSMGTPAFLIAALKQYAWVIILILLAVAYLVFA